MKNRMDRMIGGEGKEWNGVACRTAQIASRYHIIFDTVSQRTRHGYDAVSHEWICQSLNVNY